MSFLTSLGVLLFHIAAIILIGGPSFKRLQYRRPLAPLKIPTTPAPITRGGVAIRLLKEVTVFTSLFKPNRWIGLFHAALLRVLPRYLRYFTESVKTPPLKTMRPGP